MDDPETSSNKIQATSNKESLSQALQSRIIPNQEYYLQGSILDSSLEHLIHRLRGLCDNVDTAPETFNDLEVCLSFRQQNAVPLVLRLRKALDRDVPYQLRYCGQVELGTRPTLVRSSIDVACTSTVLEFLTEMGWRVDFEYICRGFMFRKGRMKIIVSKIIKIGPTKQETEPFSTSHLVELSVLAPTGQDAIGDEMKHFAEQLKPLVQLEKVDHKRMGTMP